jgi:peptidoglycan lytic transglycosylase G
MSNRRSADPHTSGRTTGSFARSPAERLEPTRPAARRRRQRFRREPGASRPIVRLLSGVLTLLLLGMLLAAVLAVMVHSQINAPGPLAQSKVLVVPKGESSHQIADRLERDGFVSDRRLFIAGYLLSRVSGWVDRSRPVQLKAGEFLIPQAASVRQIIDIVAEGRTITYKVTVPEGLTSEQIVERLKADTNLSGTVAEVPAEGSLLPETFIVQRGATRQSIVEKMHSESRKLAEKLWAQRKKDLPYKTWDEAVVLASIVEKETGRNDERDRVAAVFVNRLKQKIRLHSDPTILYGISGGKTVWNRPILRSEIAQKTSHNTYQIDGLPPTPICNPGKAAIEATLNPADTKDLYFVADGSGGHVFAETLKEHNANVQKWRAVEKEMKAKAGSATPPTDTPTTASPKPRAVVRTPPGAPADKGKAAPAEASQTALPPRSNQDGTAWAPTTQPAGSPSPKR